MGDPAQNALDPKKGGKLIRAKNEPNLKKIHETKEVKFGLRTKVLPTPPVFNPPRLTIFKDGRHHGFDRALGAPRRGCPQGPRGCVPYSAGRGTSFSWARDDFTPRGHGCRRSGRGGRTSRRVTPGKAGGRCRRGGGARLATYISTRFCGSISLLVLNPPLPSCLPLPFRSLQGRRCPRGPSLGHRDEVRPRAAPWGCWAIDWAVGGLDFRLGHHSPAAAPLGDAGEASRRASRGLSEPPPLSGTHPRRPIPSEGIGPMVGAFFLNRIGIHSTEKSQIADFFVLVLLFIPPPPFPLTARPSPRVSPCPPPSPPASPPSPRSRPPPRPPRRPRCVPKWAQ